MDMEDDGVVVDCVSGVVFVVELEDAEEVVDSVVGTVVVEGEVVDVVVVDTDGDGFVVDSVLDSVVETVVVEDEVVDVVVVDTDGDGDGDDDEVVVDSVLGSVVGTVVVDLEVVDVVVVDTDGDVDGDEVVVDSVFDSVVWTVVVDLEVVDVVVVDTEDEVDDVVELEVVVDSLGAVVVVEETVSGVTGGGTEELEEVETVAEDSVLDAGIVVDDTLDEGTVVDDALDEGMDDTLDVEKLVISVQLGQTVEVLVVILLVVDVVIDVEEVKLVVVSDVEEVLEEVLSFGSTVVGGTVSKDIGVVGTLIVELEVVLGVVLEVVVEVELEVVLEVELEVVLEVILEEELLDSVQRVHIVSVVVEGFGVEVEGGTLDVEVVDVEVEGGILDVDVVDVEVEDVEVTTELVEVVDVVGTVELFETEHPGQIVDTTVEGPGTLERLVMVVHEGQTFEVEIVVVENVLVERHWTQPRVSINQRKVLESSIFLWKFYYYYYYCCCCFIPGHGQSRYLSFFFVDLSLLNTSVFIIKGIKTHTKLQKSPDPINTNVLHFIYLFRIVSLVILGKNNLGNVYCKKPR